MKTDDWTKSAACRDEPKDTYFAHEDGRTPLPPRAIELCSRCPVGLECYTYALQYEDYGYWAGTTAKERRLIREALGMTLERANLRQRDSPMETYVNLRSELRLEPRPRSDD